MNRRVEFSERQVPGKILGPHCFAQYLSCPVRFRHERDGRSSMVNRRAKFRTPAMLNLRLTVIDVTPVGVVLI
jgi:hypothetical protein